MKLFKSALSIIHILLFVASWSVFYFAYLLYFKSIPTLEDVEKYRDRIIACEAEDASKEASRYEKFLKKNDLWESSSTEGVFGSCRYDVAIGLELGGDYDDALEIYQALKVSGERLVLNDIARVLYKEGKTEEAIETYFAYLGAVLRKEWKDDSSPERKTFYYATGAEEEKDFLRERVNATLMKGRPALDSCFTSSETVWKRLAASDQEYLYEALESEIEGWDDEVKDKKASLISFVSDCKKEWEGKAKKSSSSEKRE
ncbi:MAG: hypothetical protein ACI4NP_03910 [Thermoguttaceae bacterium]